MDSTVADWAMIGELANAIAPMTGNAFLAASLKNSLRDWIFSFFSFMMLGIYIPPYSLDGISGFSYDFESRVQNYIVNTK